jgi:hypothetical protein
MGRRWGLTGKRAGVLGLGGASGRLALGFRSPVSDAQSHLEAPMRPRQD